MRISSTVFKALKSPMRVSWKRNTFLMAPLPSRLTNLYHPSASMASPLLNCRTFTRCGKSMDVFRNLSFSFLLPYLYIMPISSQ